MCGIAGILAIGEPDSIAASATGMQRALLNRGPDDRGLLVRQFGKWTAALAHTRLAILDLSEDGHQPMRARQTPCWVTYNGEIYNFRELRDELPGGAYRSQSDTEVLLRLYETQGLDALSRLRGMYAFAVWDEVSGALTLARDPLGIKPLYVYRTAHSVVFASEVRALLASGLVSRRLSMAGLESFLETGSVHAPLTILDGVQSLMPGEVMTFKAGDTALRFDRRWIDSELFSDRGGTARTPSEAVAGLREVLEDSVRRHLISDVPVGLFLSGGIDSSALVALASRESSQPLRTFSVVFDEAEYSEMSPARLVAKTFGAEHQEIRLTEDSVLSLIPLAIEGMDQPTSDSVNTYVISRAVRASGVKVALSGLGGDELFAGYRSFARADSLRSVAKVPQPVRHALSELGRGITPGSARMAKVWDLLGGECTPQSIYRLSRQYFSTLEIRSLLNGNYIGGRSAVEDSGWSDPVNAMSVHELRGYMTDTLLRDTDCQSMAHALEVRVPFVDKVVARYVLDLPGGWKLDPRRAKPLLLDALGGQLPPQVWQRPKMGFVLPFHRWMQTTLRADLDRVLGSTSGGLERIGLQPAATRRLWQSFLEHPDPRRWSRPWSLYALSLWCERHGIEL